MFWLKLPLVTAGVKVCPFTLTVTLTLLLTASDTTPAMVWLLWVVVKSCAGWVMVRDGPAVTAVTVRIMVFLLPARSVAVTEMVLGPATRLTVAVKEVPVT